MCAAVGENREIKRGDRAGSLGVCGIKFEWQAVVGVRGQIDR